MNFNGAGAVEVHGPALLVVHKDVDLVLHGAFEFEQEIIPPPRATSEAWAKIIGDFVEEDINCECPHENIASYVFLPDDSVFVFAPETLSIRHGAPRLEYEPTSLKAGPDLESRMTLKLSSRSTIPPTANTEIAS